MLEEATLEANEPHPMAHVAMRYIKNLGVLELILLQEAMASTALSVEDPRTLEIGLSTLNRLVNRQPVSDRYIMGLFIQILLIRGELKDE